MPVLFEYPDNGPFMAITEASLVDYAGMYLMKRRGSLIQTELSPLPGQGGIKAKIKLPNKTPWRVIMISDKVETLMESNILTNLCEPNKIKDISWIKTGKTTWPWWNGNVLPDSLSDKGMNFETNKYYIDFCAANDIAFHSIVEYGGHEWYTSDGKNFYPGPNTDVTKPVKDLDMQKVCDYAATKGVGIRVWVHWKAIEKRLEEAFTQFETWGVKGMMIDFMDRDDQDMVNLQIKMLQVAAAHKLHVQFHGAYKPTGLHRTYPNEFTREGTLNYEVNKWDTTVNPDHDINIPFTRMLAGPTDYHLGGFRAVPGSEFKPQYTAPLMTGTRAHMLAMYVVLESYLGMLADYPDAYIGQPGFDFLKIVPTTWDEIKVVAAKPGDWVSIARRKNTDWYIGTITNRTAREEKLNLGFLPEGEFEATIFSDKENSEKNPNLLDIQTITLSNKDILPIKLAAGGGQAIYLRKK
jgi:alpha-glucosidase